MYYSSIIPKYNNRSIEICDYINMAIKRYCYRIKVHFIDTRNLFVNKETGLRCQRLSIHDKLHLNRDGVMDIGKHINFFVNTEYIKIVDMPPPYYPGPPARLPAPRWQIENGARNLHIKLIVLETLQAF